MKNKKILSILISIFIIVILLILGGNKLLLDSKVKDKNISISNVIEGKAYYSKEDVSLYLHKYKKLPKNYLTKIEAKKLGWNAKEGNLWDVTDKGVIGGDRFFNREGKLPKTEKYFEADVNYSGGRRNSERLIYTKEGKVIYYTGNHYKNFEVLYE